MNPVHILFFGSTSDSVLVLEKLDTVVAVVTQPPKPVGRNKVVTPTPVETWARNLRVPVFTEVPEMSVDLLITASYGEKIPIEFIRCARFGGLNVHPSLLPRWRGGDPVPWAILMGDTDIGVTVVTLSEKFDQGRIVAQKKIPIAHTDVSDPLRTKLFTIGAELLVSVLPEFLSGKNKGRVQPNDGEPYARRLTRDDGLEPWEKIMDPKESDRINRKFRAFHPWPGLWTKVNGKRLKILDFDVQPVTVQLEGKKPVPFAQFRTAYLPS